MSLVAFALFAAVVVLLSLMGALERIKRDSLAHDERASLVAALIAKNAGEYTAYERIQAQAQHPSTVSPMVPKPRMVGFDN